MSGRGRVSIEYRNILINAADIPATVLARCAGGRAYFNMGHELLRSQAQWVGGMRGLSEAQRGQLRDQPPTVHVAAPGADARARPDRRPPWADARRRSAPASPTMANFDPARSDLEPGEQPIWRHAARRPS